MFFLFISHFGFKSGICRLFAQVRVHCFSIRNIPGFECAHVFAKKSRRAKSGRSSGGVSVCFKTSSKPYVSVVDIPSRVSRDSILDNNGRRLLNLCKSSGFLIGNGRLGADQYIGDFTCVTNQGRRVVDYFYCHIMTLNIFHTL